ncbi:hypothetical protein RRG08_035138 [Elysia crispata]|uniref:Uncharacterized protein n=1 Tax=Elysia crispata TaxID=231223 RepID=A0AAE1AKQ7_9GAST|nr:hypothetical protein RRG08_035138 [Elysia crispata]
MQNLTKLCGWTISDHYTRELARIWSSSRHTCKLSQDRPGGIGFYTAGTRLVTPCGAISWFQPLRGVSITTAGLEIDNETLSRQKRQTGSTPPGEDTSLHGRQDSGPHSRFYQRQLLCGGSSGFSISDIHIYKSELI